MASSKVDVKLSADVTQMVGQILATQALMLHDLLTGAGFERTGERIVQHTGSGVMVALHPDGFRVSYYCPEAQAGTGFVDLPLSAKIGQVAHLALALHREESDEID